jgi:hypothetical protein
MTFIKGVRETRENIELEFKPLGQSHKMRFLDEILKSVEPDSPHVGMTDEKILAQLTYFLDPELWYESRKDQLIAKRVEPGWKRRPLSGELSLDISGELSKYRICYIEREMEVFR